MKLNHSQINHRVQVAREQATVRYVYGRRH
jgi:hypothetical protein